VCVCVCARAPLPAYFTMLLLTHINRHMVEGECSGMNELMLYCGAAGLFINEY